MDIKKVIGELEKKYPGKRIVVNDKKNPTEVVCETDPSSKHPEKSTAIAVIDNVIEHYHRKSTEVYTVLKGELKIIKNGKQQILKKGGFIEIKPGEKHSAEGKETWIEVKSKPGWNPDDHFFDV